jgi:hypothetical protein
MLPVVDASNGWSRALMLTHAAGEDMTHHLIRAVRMMIPLFLPVSRL